MLYWASKACKRFTIPHELPLDHFYVHCSWQAQAKVSSDRVNLNCTGKPGNTEIQASSTAIREKEIESCVS